MTTPDFAALLRELDTHEAPGPPSPTDLKVLDATLGLLGEIGERRITVDDVAAASGVARATVFRRFGTKDAVISQTYAREVRRALLITSEAAGAAGTAVDALAAGFGRLADHCLAHPVLIRMARTEPETLVRLWREGDPVGLDVVTAVLRSLTGSRAADQAVIVVSDSLARLLLSWLLLGQSEHREDLVASLVRSRLPVAEAS